MMQTIIKFPKSSNIKEGFDKLFKKLEKEKFSLDETTKTKINIFNIDISKEYNVDLAKLVFEYNCELVGISEDRLSIINSIINTGYFLKTKLSKIEYYNLFRELLENIDFNFIILDNVYKNSINKEKDIEYYVIKPLYFDSKYFYYQKLKSHFTEPKNLERALDNNVNIWEMGSIRIQDISDVEVGFRLASNKKEYEYLMLYNEIISRRLKGFYRKEVY